MKPQRALSPTDSGPTKNILFGNFSTITLPAEANQKKQTYAVITNVNESVADLVKRISENTFLERVEAAYPSEISEKTHLVLEYLEYKLSINTRYDLSVLSKLNPAKLQESVANSFLFYTKRCRLAAQEKARSAFTFRLKVWIKRHGHTERLIRLEQLL
jgi:hypothetical protein